MATDLAALVAELEAATKLEEDRINGYVDFAQLPLSEEAKAEISQAHAWSAARHSLLATASSAIQQLMLHGYPSRDEQLVPASVLDEISRILALLTRTATEFHLPPTGTLTFSEPTPV